MTIEHESTPSSTGPAQRSRVRNLVTAALIAAIMAALGPVAVTGGAVPITLQIFPVVLAALLLSPGWAASSMALYVALGAVGVPVYAHHTAGIGVLLGPTGGYLMGFIAGAWIGAVIRKALAPRSSAGADIAAAAATVLVAYGVGWAWLAFGPAHVPGDTVNARALAAFFGGVLPFLIPDAIKAAVAILVATAVRRAQRAG